MVATNINWTEAPYEMSGWYYAESEEALRVFFKDYEIEITDVGPVLDCDGFTGRIYRFRGRLKTGN